MAYEFPRCRVVPLAGEQAAFELDGVERLRWHYGQQYPRPFFYPLVGPSGHSLTRMGHPGAPNHEHHRSIWFAHFKALGINFWNDETVARIRQHSWLVYEDSDEHAAMAVSLRWYDGHDPQELLEQEVIAIVRPGEDGETFVELETIFRPRAETFEFQATNFGFFAVRVAKSIAAHFGGGQLTNSAGMQGEPNIFGKPAKWMDYSGPVPGGAIEGITYFDHPSNPGYPSSWHVREDGWMGASPCMHESLTTTRVQPLSLRYLLHAHRGGADNVRAEKVAAEYANRPAHRVAKGTRQHEQFELQLVESATSVKPTSR